ncbi:MAG: hypothetical protein WCZ90_17080 [Melioribacteraceae bacterium]
MIKLLLQYFPSNLKKLLFPSSIVLSIISTIAYLYLANQEIIISQSALINLLIAFFIYLFLVSGVGVFISYNRILFHLYNKSNSSPSITITNETVSAVNKAKELKYIPWQFELEVLSKNIVEYTVFIRRSWYPDEPRPGLESFLEAISFSNPRCGKCHSDFYKGYRNYGYVECTSQECENNKRIDESELDTFSQQTIVQYKGNIRNNFDNYWKRYKKIYDEFTDKEYREFLKPSR